MATHHHLISEIMVPGPNSHVADFLEQKQQMITRLKHNLAQAHARMKKYADQSRSERQFLVGDLVYLKLQPHIHHAFGVHLNLKLRTRYYGPFRVSNKIGQSAYKLHLPESAGIHLVFHVS
jgi:hypothetical protein